MSQIATPKDEDTGQKPALSAVLEEKADDITIEDLASAIVRKLGAPGSKWSNRLLVGAMALLAGTSSYSLTELASLPSAVEENTRTIRAVTVTLAGERDELTNEVKTPGLAQRFVEESERTQTAMKALQKSVDNLTQRVRTVEAYTVPGPVPAKER